MSALREALTGFCAACLGLGALLLLAPSGRLEKSLRYLFALLLLCLLASPLRAAVRLPSVSFSAGAQTGEQQSALCALAAAQAEYLARAVLAEAGVYPEKITVKTDISPQGDIGISSIAVTGGDVETIRRLLQEALAVNEVEVFDE